MLAERGRCCIGASGCAPLTGTGIGKEVGAGGTAYSGLIFRMMVYYSISRISGR
jgi:hypothetical protein